MTPREIVIVEVWKAESLVSGVRLIELDEKRQDQGLTVEEKIEYIRVKEENHSYFKKMVAGFFGKLLEG